MELWLQTKANTDKDYLSGGYHCSELSQLMVQLTLCSRLTGPVRCAAMKGTFWLCPVPRPCMGAICCLCQVLCHARECMQSVRLICCNVGVGTRAAGVICP